MLHEIMQMLIWVGEGIEWSIVPQNNKFAMVYVDTYRDANGLPTVEDDGRAFRALELLEHEAIEYDYSDDDREWYYFEDCTVCWGYKVMQLQAC